MRSTYECHTRVDFGEITHSGPPAVGSSTQRGPQEVMLVGGAAAREDTPNGRLDIQPFGCMLVTVVAVAENEDRVDALFHALADRTRRDILRRVLVGEHSVSALAEPYEMSFASVQKHVAVLERAGLLSKRRNGREQLAHGEVEVVRSIASMLAELENLWRGRIARIDDLLALDPQQHQEQTRARH